MARPRNGQYLCTHCGKPYDSILALHEHEKTCKNASAEEPLYQGATSVVPIRSAIRVRL
ncbi:MAG: hypothetical protein ACRD1N_02300 [Terriglobia bacterium]